MSSPQPNTNTATQQLKHGDIRPPTEKYHRLMYLLNDVGDPVNVGGILRLSDGLGVEKVILCGRSPSPGQHRSKRVERVARNARTPFQYMESASAAVERCMANGYAVYAVELTNNSTSLFDVVFDTSKPTVLVMGCEKYGVDDSILTQVPSVHIPMFGHCSSLNVTTAASIAGYEFVRQCHANKLQLVEQHDDPRPPASLYDAETEEAMASVAIMNELFTEA